MSKGQITQVWLVKSYRFDGHLVGVFSSLEQAKKGAEKEAAKHDKLLEWRTDRYGTDGYCIDGSYSYTLIPFNLDRVIKQK